MIKKKEFNNLDKTNDYEFVNHPAHYKREGRKECIDEIVDLFGRKKAALWCEMTAYKYEYRMGHKPDNTIEQDSKKAEWYTNKANELRGNDTLTYSAKNSSAYNSFSIKDKYLLSVKEAAEYFGIGEQKIRQLIVRNKNNNFTLEIGSHIKIKRRQFEKFLDNQIAI